MGSNELKVETIRKEDEVQIYKVEGEGVAVTFTNSTKTGRLYIDGKGSRKHKNQIIDAVIKHNKDVALGKPSRVSLPVMIKVNIEGNEELIKVDDYIKEKLSEFENLGYQIKEKDLKNQIEYILENEDDKLNSLGIIMKKEIVIE